MRKALFLLTLLLSSLSSLSRTVMALDVPIIDAIEGDKIVIVKTAKGNRAAGRGTAISFGDVVKTGPRATARILFPDGSKLLLGKSSEIEVQQNEGSTQRSDLRAGQVRGLIKKGELAPGKPPKFMISSRTVTMGVRGTDFVFNLENPEIKSSPTEIHTLEGTVEVAKDAEALLSGKGVRVEKNQMVQATEEGIGDVSAFDNEAYVKDMTRYEPGLVKLSRDEPEDPKKIKGDTGQRPQGSDYDDYVNPGYEAKKPSKETGFRFHEYRVYGAYGAESPIGPLFKAGTKFLYSLGLSWNPSIELPGPFAVRGQLGVGASTGGAADAATLSYHFAVLGSITIFHVFLEAGVGTQKIKGGIDPSGSLRLVNLGWEISSPVIERIFIGGTDFDQPPRDNNHRVDILLGVGLKF